MTMESQQMKSTNPPCLTMSNTVIVFDFDDTLFPTKKFKEIKARPNALNKSCSHPNYSGSLISKMNASEMKAFIELSWTALNLLTLYINKYSSKNICIVSASEAGWVKRALLHVYGIGCFKQIYDLIFNPPQSMNNNKDRITIYNPTDKIIRLFQVKNTYKSYNEHPCMLWKYNVFKRIFDDKFTKSVDDYHGQISYNVINTFVFIGDSEFEYLAAHKLRVDISAKNKDNEYQDAFIVRIKLLYKPSIQSLINEHKDLYSRCGSYESYSFINRCGFDVMFEENKNNDDDKEMKSGKD